MKEGLSSEIYCYHHMGIDTSQVTYYLGSALSQTPLQRAERCNRRSARNCSYLYHPTRIYEIKRKQKLSFKLNFCFLFNHILKHPSSFDNVS